MNPIYQNILEHPEAPALAQELNKILAAESERRHAFREWIDESQKAEFINGEVVLHSPVKRRHWKTSSLLATLLNVHTLKRKTGSVGVEKVMIGLTRNDYEPDICFFEKSKADAFTEDQMIFPAPDFVVEILSKRTAKNDKTIKKQDYAAHGIREYWIIDPNKKTIEQYFLLNSLEKEYFQPYIYTIVDDIESKVIEGFKIPVLAIFDEATNVAALEELLKK